MEYQEKVKNIIYKWVEQEFGETEAESPSWCIEALADEISKHAWELYDITDREGVRNDIEYVAEEILQKDLTDAQLDAITGNYMRSDAYCSADTESIEYYINKELALTKNKEGK